MPPISGYKENNHAPDCLSACVRAGPAFAPQARPESATLLRHSPSVQRQTGGRATVSGCLGDGIAGVGVMIGEIDLNRPLSAPSLESRGAPRFRTPTAFASVRLPAASPLTTEPDRSQ